MNARSKMVAVAVFLAGCRVGPDYRAPADAVPDRWSEEPQDASLTANPAHPGPDAVDLRWWTSFGDARLDSLIERALQQNLDLELARARVREARALRDAAASGRYPKVDVGALYARTKTSANTTGIPPGTPRVNNLYDFGFDASWELDIFGGVARTVEAADAGVGVAEDSRRDAIVSLLGEVARNYMELRGAQRQLALTRENLSVQQDSLELTRSRFAAGFAPDLDVARAEAQVADTAALIPAFDIALRQNLHRLAVLMGEAPGALSAELEKPEPVPVAPDSVAAGVPSELLRRRPDIRRAERELAQATALTGVATADLFPKISLVGSVGQRSNDLASLFDGASNFWSFGPALTMPIFHGGELQANLRAQEARQEEALIAYRITVLGALEEVENALVAVSRERQRMNTLAEAVASNRRALDQARELNEKGLVDFFQVLDVQRNQLVAESELAKSTTNLSSDTVALYKALGGGWESEELPAPEAEGKVARAADAPRGD
jgi:NodT family efflux transporter outer membrane factor (OMF) lipoprotein